MLPPGGESNIYWDCIGAPVNLWQATEEYGLLRTVRFVMLNLPHRFMLI